MKNQIFNDLKPSINIGNFVVDKVDLSLALDFEEELKETRNLVQKCLNLEDGNELETKFVIITNEQLKVEGVDDIKSTFMNDRKTAIIKLKEQSKSTSNFESVLHLAAECDSDVQIFLIFYTLLKFNVIKGRTLVLLIHFFYI